MTSSSRKAFAVLIAALTIAAAPVKDYAPYPQPDSGYVTDLAGLLSEQEEERLEQWLIRTEEGTRTEIIVVTIPSMRGYPGSSNGSIEEFARALFNTWGIGNRPKNDGILLFVSVNDRKARIELGAGYPASRDADANRIMQNTIVPEFRKGNLAKGIEKGVKAIVAEFTDYRVGVNWPLVMYPLLILIAAIVAISLFRSGRKGWGWVVVGLILLLLLALLRALKEVSRFGESSTWSPGGLGGFGGGSSRGGGATGSW
ncbi:MAG TPA: TPM domain-containing protein [Thermoanaerobaculia bacterium]|nr:TPM domain-containing protein [Thermoanaerobaculia bacterium]